VQNYPRGNRELLGPFHRFGPTETFAWFNKLGVELKTEEDGRVFPITDNSETIISCLQNAASKAGVIIKTRCGVTSLVKVNHGFKLGFSNGDFESFDKVLIATGGNRSSAGLQIAQQLGHTVIPTVPSLFTFHIDSQFLKGLEGLSVLKAEAKIERSKYFSQGPMLITHWGLSGPAILKLSSIAARTLSEIDYKFNLMINWAAPLSLLAIEASLNEQKIAHSKKLILTANPFGLPSRLWERLCLSAKIGDQVQWAGVSKILLQNLTALIGASNYVVNGKSMNKEEFVTCGGIKLSEIDFVSMQSRICPNLYFAGEVLDIDGITGGFNFQAAWTTGWHAGKAMASV
jgi:predicted Rossmann fold flavoprotein